MPNANMIIAIASDTGYAAVQYDGAPWQLIENETARWKSISGSQGKFMYTTIDQENKLVLQNFNTDGTSWKASVMPSEVKPCFVALLDGLSINNQIGTPFTSFDGVTFTTPFTTPGFHWPVAHEVHCMATSTANGKFYTPSRLNLLAYSPVISTFARVASFRRTVAATATSIVSIITGFIW